MKQRFQFEVLLSAQRLAGNKTKGLIIMVYGLRSTVQKYFIFRSEGAYFLIFVIIGSTGVRYPITPARSEAAARPYARPSHAYRYSLEVKNSGLLRLIGMSSSRLRCILIFCVHSFYFDLSASVCS